MPNLLHVRWLSEGVESWNRRRTEAPFDPELPRVVVHREFWEAFSVDSPYWIGLEDHELSGVDLRSANLRGAVLNKGVFTGADFGGADLRQAWFNQADFSDSDFAGADLDGSYGTWAKFTRSKFENASMKLVTFDGCDFTGASLRGSDLTSSQFAGTDMVGADLSNTVLKDTYLVTTRLERARLEDARLWHANLFDRDGYGKLRPTRDIDSFHLNSVGDILNLREHLQDVYRRELADRKVILYFRGEQCSRWPLRPSVMRDNLRGFERDLLIELQKEHPAEFSGRDYALDRLAIARHYGLPTRLLDVTRSPLVGLYWGSRPCNRIGNEGNANDEPEREIHGYCSCRRPHVGCDGRLHVFAMPADAVRSYDSDSVSVVANFAQLTMAEQEFLLTKRIEDVDFTSMEAPGATVDYHYLNYTDTVTRLLHFIRREKPYFASRIDFRDLFRVFVVEPQRSFDRIRAQSGAFLVSGFHDRLEGREVTKLSAGSPQFDHHVLSIPAKSKEVLQSELESLNISATTLLADIGVTASAIGRQFRERGKRLADLARSGPDDDLLAGIPDMPRIDDYSSAPV